MHGDPHADRFAAALVLRFCHLDRSAAEDDRATYCQRERQKFHRFEELTVEAGQRKQGQRILLTPFPGSG